jgi:hypothetical protein
LRATGLQQQFVQDNHSRSQKAYCAACIIRWNTPRASWCV